MIHPIAALPTASNNRPAPAAPLVKRALFDNLGIEIAAVSGEAARRCFVEPLILGEVVEQLHDFAKKVDRLDSYTDPQTYLSYTELFHGFRPRKARTGTGV